MGAWGSKPFENDGALETISEFAHEGLTALEHALDDVLDCDDYLESYEAQGAIAATVFVAAANGHWHWLEDEPTVRDTLKGSMQLAEIARLRAKALLALDRALAEDSEIAELWEDAEPADRDAFLASIERLRSDLSNPL